MITKRNFLKALGLGAVAVSIGKANADIFLSKQITRTNNIQKAVVFEVTPVQVPLIDNVKLSGIRFITQDHSEVVYGAFEHKGQLYLLENPAENIEKKQDRTIVLKPYRSRIISLGSVQNYWAMNVPIEATSGEIKLVEIKTIESKIKGSNNTFPSFSINEVEYCIVKSENEAYHLIQDPNRSSSNGKDTLIFGSNSFYLGNLEAKVKP